jgi:hypothetical protein
MAKKKRKSCGGSPSSMRIWTYEFGGRTRKVKARSKRCARRAIHKKHGVWRKPKTFFQSTGKKLGSYTERRAVGHAIKGKGRVVHKSKNCRVERRPRSVLVTCGGSKVQSYKGVTPHKLRLAVRKARTWERAHR